MFAASMILHVHWRVKKREFGVTWKSVATVVDQVPPYLVNADTNTSYLVTLLTTTKGIGIH